MAIYVLNTISKSEDFDKIIIITKEKSTFSKFENKKILILEEKEETGINQAISFAYKIFKIGNEDSVLILHADIPLISENDVNWIAEHSKLHERVAIIAPSLRKDGTNALYIQPANLITFQFGKNSYEKHLQSLKKVEDIELLIFKSENISLDIDTHEDLMEFIQRKIIIIPYFKF